ncbi:MAG: hypothetical protein HPY52_15765 [Firmicutes bacterium]|nr:hypothetical protein [Bacillota bacterium]
MEATEIVCLANSRKLNGRCVAGLRTDGRGWVRPVSDRLDGALLPHEYRLNDGSGTGVLDIVKLNLLTRCPRPHQPENWLTNSWRLVRRPASKGIIPLLRSNLVNGPELLGNTFDRVPAASFSSTPAPSSLALVEPKNLQLYITLNVRNRKQPRAIFELSRVRYNLAITDPFWEERLGVLSTGLYQPTAIGLQPHDKILLTISLGEPFEGYCYKLVAAIIVLPQSWRRFW